MLAGRNCGDKANATRSYECLASSGMEEIMNGVMRWWRGRKWVPRQQRRQDAAVTWRQKTAVAISCLLFTLVATAASGDPKSTRLNSSHLGISYAVFCLKKKK